MATSSHSQTLGSITFQTGFFAEILDMQWGKIERQWIDATNMSITAASAGTFGNMVGFPSQYVNPGQLTVTVNFNPDTAIPIGAAAASCTVKMGNSSTQASWAGSASMISFEPNMPLDGKPMTAKAVLAFSGAITETAGT